MLPRLLRTKKYIGLLAVIMLTVALLVTSCAQGAKTPANDSNGATGDAGGTKEVKKEQATLHLGWVRDGTAPAFYTALHKGWYEEQGLDVTIREGTGSADTVKLIAAKQGEFGVVSLASMVEAVAKGLPVKSVMVISYDPAYAILSLKESGIAEPKDLIGKSIGTSPGGASRALLTAFLAANDLTGKVNEVSMDGKARINAVLMKQLDTALGPGPQYGTKMELAGAEVNYLYLRDAGIPVLGYGVIVHEDLIKEDPELIKRFVKASQQGLDFAKANPDEATALTAKGVDKIDMNALRGDIFGTLAFAESDEATGKPTGWQPEEAWKRTLDILGRYSDEAIGKIPVEQVYTNEFLSE